MEPVSAAPHAVRDEMTTGGGFPMGQAFGDQVEHLHLPGRVTPRSFSQVVTVTDAGATSARWRHATVTAGAEEVVEECGDLDQPGPGIAPSVGEGGIGDQQPRKLAPPDPTADARRSESQASWRPHPARPGPQLVELDQLSSMNVRDTLRAAIAAYPPIALIGDRRRSAAFIELCLRQFLGDAVEHAGVDVSAASSRRTGGGQRVSATDDVDRRIERAFRDHSTPDDRP